MSDLPFDPSNFPPGTIPNMPNEMTFTNFQLAVAEVENGEGETHPALLLVLPNTIVRIIVTYDNAELVSKAFAELVAKHDSTSQIQLPTGAVIHTPQGPKVVPIKRNGKEDTDGLQPTGE